MTDFNFNPSTAESIAGASKGFAGNLSDLYDLVSFLRSANGCGGFPSGSAIQTSLTQLGDVANQMSTRLNKAIIDYEKSVIAAGGLITQQEAENQRNITKAGEGGGASADSDLSGLLLPGKRTPATIPNGPNNTDLINSAVTTGLPPVPDVSSDAAGKFACPAAPETVGGITLDLCVANLSSAQAAKLTMLAQQWQQLGADLSSAITTFHRIVQMKMQAGGWTGTSGPAVGAAAHKLVSTTAEISAQATANGAAIVSWAGALGDTKSYMDELNTARTAATATTPPESQAVMRNQIDMMARMKMLGTYNPGVTAIASGLSNLTDPSSPVAGVPLMLNGSSPGSPGAAATAARTGTSGAPGGGGSSGGSGGGSTAGANKSTSDAAKTLSRQGSGDPAAATTAAKPAAAQSGQGNPASAAQSAMSKAGDTAKGLGGKGSNSPLTRSAGLGSLTDAEKSAAKGGAGLGKLGGAGGGGGGLGKLGGAGIAASEGSLSARSAASLSAAERAIATPQAAPAATRAGMSQGGTPMGGRGAAGNSENDKEHKSARYLISEENGDEIAGDLPDVAPPVLGGLNLDTSDTPETPTPR